MPLPRITAKGSSGPLARCKCAIMAGFEPACGVSHQPEHPYLSRPSTSPRPLDNLGLCSLCLTTSHRYGACHLWLSQNVPTAQPDSTTQISKIIAHGLRGDGLPVSCTSPVCLTAPMPGHHPMRCRSNPNNPHRFTWVFQCPRYPI